MFIQASFSVAQAKVPASRASDAATFIALAQNLGIVLALAISGAVFQNKALAELQKLLPQMSRSQLRGAITGSNSSILGQISAATRERVLHAVVGAMSRTYYLVVAAGALTIVGSLFMKVCASPVLGFDKLTLNDHSERRFSSKPQQRRRLCRFNRCDHSRQEQGFFDHIA